jgi:hypothetical protein
MKPEIDPDSLTITLLPSPGGRFHHKAGKDGFTEVTHNPDGSVTLLKTEWIAMIERAVEKLKTKTTR